MCGKLNSTITNQEFKTNFLSFYKPSSYFQHVAYFDISAKSLPAVVFRKLNFSFIAFLFFVFFQNTTGILHSVNLKIQQKGVLPSNTVHLE